mmetsp:Transcript_22031/g.53640  ORF Transcript_22031/g.53640 Transcript_22031/m.53640 type:complete len:205 (-) Transcript_22031:1929-2543(-)
MVIHILVVLIIHYKLILRLTLMLHNVPNQLGDTIELLQEITTCTLKHLGVSNLLENYWVHYPVHEMPLLKYATLTNCVLQSTEIQSQFLRLLQNPLDHSLGVGDSPISWLIDGLAMIQPGLAQFGLEPVSTKPLVALEELFKTLTNLEEASTQVVLYSFRWALVCQGDIHNHHDNDADDNSCDLRIRGLRRSTIVLQLVARHKK